MKKKIQKISVPDLKKMKHVACMEDMPDIHILIPIWGFFTVTDWNYRAFKRPYWIFYWNAETGHVLTLGKKQIELCPEKVYLFPPYTEIAGTKNKDFLQFYVHFRVEGDAFENIRNEMLEFPSGNFPEQIREIVTAKEKLRQSIKLHRMICELLSMIPASHFVPDARKIQDPRIHLVLQMINNAPGDPNKIKELCSIVKMSQNNFHRRFLAETNVTPKQYILRKRLEYARQLLMDTRKTLDEIAENAGFFNRYHLSKVFKGYYKYPPVTYKKQMLIIQSTRYAGDPTPDVAYHRTVRKN